MPLSAIPSFPRLKIDNWRWAGVPFYLRTGKRLAVRSTEIAIRFKRAPYALFRETPMEELDADWLILRVQPDESIRLRFNAKRPGPAMTLEDALDLARSEALDLAILDFHLSGQSSEPVAVALTRQLMVRGLGLTHPLQAH